DIVTNCPADKVISIVGTAFIKHPEADDSFFANNIDLTCSSLSLVELAKRCDLTVNALFANRFGQIFDPLHKIADLDKSAFEMVDTPSKLFTDDAVRILRLIKAHFHVGKSIDPFIQVM